METLSIGKLVSMETKLGVAVSSDSCKRLNTPFVTLLLKIEDAGGVVTSHSVELSLAQFQTFSKSIKEIDALMKSNFG